MRLEKITTRDRQPASLFQTRDQGSQLDRPDHACPEIRIERADLVPERSELEAGIEPTGDVGMVQSTEAEKPGIESIAEKPIAMQTARATTRQTSPDSRVRTMIKHSMITPPGWNTTFQRILPLLHRLHLIVQGRRS